LNSIAEDFVTKKTDIGDTDAYDLIDRLGRQARAAAHTLAGASTDSKNRALRAAAAALRERSAELLEANRADVALAEKGSRPAAFIDRLRLDEGRIEAMAAAIENIAELPDPVGRTLSETERPNGLRISRVSTPLGVIGMIYESRPNVGADASALCIKAGNAVILRGGSESRQSTSVIAGAMQAGLAQAGLPEHCVQFIDTADRRAVTALLQCAEHVDLVIPRGGRGLVSLVSSEARVPTLLHLDGNCHTYVHAAADPAKAVDIIRNAKLRRTGICGATESLVIDAAIADSLLPRLLDAMPECAFRGDARAQAADERVAEATDEDWDEEYLDAVLSVRVVDDLAAAMAFVTAHSSGHTDAIITEDTNAAEQFLRGIDSAVVMHNASTQFSDGGEFGMGAEIGIATGKMHARGPVGLEQLNTFKYQVRGSGQTRS
jgi:glutamate-5-semialdehyde dehydrogenase